MRLKLKRDSVRLEILLFLAQDRCTVCAECIIGTKLFWTHLMALLGSRLKRKLISVRLEKVLILTQDRCMVCPKSTIVSETIMDAADGTPR
jgi:ferredoxin